MLKKSAVFCGNKSVLNDQRHGAWFDFFSSRRAQLLYDFAPGREQRDGPWSIETGDSSGIRQGRINQLRERTGS
jgi:hypothetical protein